MSSDAPRAPHHVDRSHWHVQVVTPADDRAALEAAFDATHPSTPMERLALAWQLSVEAARLAGWGDGEQRLHRPAAVSPRA